MTTISLQLINAAFLDGIIPSATSALPRMAQFDAIQPEQSAQTVIDSLTAMQQEQATLARGESTRIPIGRGKAVKGDWALLMPLKPDSDFVGQFRFQLSGRPSIFSWRRTPDDPNALYPPNCLRDIAIRLKPKSLQLHLQGFAGYNRAIHIEQGGSILIRGDAGNKVFGAVQSGVLRVTLPLLACPLDSLQLSSELAVSLTPEVLSKNESAYFEALRTLIAGLVQYVLRPKVDMSQIRFYTPHVLYGRVRLKDSTDLRTAGAINEALPFHSLSDVGDAVTIYVKNHR